MKRKEEIEKAAMQVAGVHPVWSNLDCFRMGFREGAKFADRTMLDRACEWLAEHICPDEIYEYETDETPTTYLAVNLHDNMLDFINDFRRAMKGGAE